MLLLSDQLQNIPIMGLQTGGQLAHTTDVIVDPKDLSIIAFYVSGPGLEPGLSVLFTDDIRETGELGFIIDDTAKLMPLDGLVRLQKLIDENFTLIDTPVVDKHANKLGKIEDYSFDPASFSIQQLYIKPPLLKAITTGSHIVHCSQIVEIKAHLIIVDVPDVEDHVAIPVDDSSAASGFVNPFRSPDAESHSKTS